MEFFDHAQEGMQDGSLGETGTSIHLAGVGAHLLGGPTHARDNGIVTVGEVDNLTL
jgi:hypothetical protein